MNERADRGRGAAAVLPDRREAAEVPAMKLRKSDFNARGRLLASTARWLLAKDLKYCPRHDGGKGKVLPVHWFSLRGTGFGRCGYCQACTRKYQHGKHLETVLPTRRS